ncbi:MAG: hypothetical protein M1823_002743 [Watsoniomyces obsoletus]|nr:MAG: hypothetical protein M1823_002743 [Watsoniomyces obsoletus]
MDLRSIINTDAPSTVKPSQETRAHESTRTYGSPTAAAPPVLPPTQQPSSYLSRHAPPTPTDLRFANPSSAHDQLRSPYTSGSPSSALSGGGQFPFPARSPGYGPVPGSAAHAYARASPMAGVPPIQTTPHAYAHHSAQSVSPASGGGYQYGTAQYPPHPIHASPTISTMTSPTPQTSQDSPTSAHSHHHHYPASYYSHPSQPATPLGPPTGYPYSATPYRPEMSQTSNQSPRDSAGPSHISAQQQQHSYPSMVPPQAASEVRPSEPAGATDQTRRGGEYAAQRERERSLSVSPKTMLPDPSRRQSQQDLQGNGQVVPAKRKQPYEGDNEHGHTRSGVNGVKHQTAAAVYSPPASSTTGRPYFDPIEGRETVVDRKMSSPVEVKPTPAEMKSRELSVSSVKEVIKLGDSPVAAGGGTRSHQPSTTPHSMSGRGSPVAPSNSTLPGILSPLGPPSGPTSNATGISKREGSAAAAAVVSSSDSPPPRAKKRARRDEPPIYARKVGQVVPSRSSSSVGPRNKRPGGGTSISSGKVDAHSPTKDGQQAATSTHEDGGVALPQGQPSLTDEGPLGPWEPSITNVIPYEEITRKIMDFLFMEVVERKDVGVNTGAAQLEIEAKLGQLIDKNTNERIRLPVLTECIFNKDHPSWRTAFRSSMTESQHRTLNQFLNKAVVSSNARSSPSATSPSSSSANNNNPNTSTNSKARIPLQYVHTRELDRFYELPTSQLPASIPLSVRPLLHSRGHRTKVRVTHDQKTGEQLAQIIKIRIADLDVYSPRTAFDWRVSVNLEMPFDGDISGSTEVTEANKAMKRNKDRMTYRHLAYQIDLTQVTLQGEAGKVEKEHELEIEVSATKIREQGNLAKDGLPTQYEDLVRGFVDNVRMLNRVVNVP